MRTPTLSLLVSVALLPLASSALAAPSSAPSVPTMQQEPDVVGGTQAPPGKWNDAAAVFFGGSAGCTGTLIAPDLVLTAGHCIGGITAVKLGVNDWSSDGGETIAVVQEIEYPNSLSTYDVGLLVLERASTYEPRMIATGCVLERSLRDGARVAIVGYGATDAQGNQYTSKQMEAETTVVDHDCNGGRGCNGSVSPNGELTAGGNGIDSCFGDSGGPLYLLDEGGPVLVGVTSRGFSDSSLPCSEGGIYVRPDAIIDWIEQQSGASLPRATCNMAPSAWAEGLEPGQAGELVVEAGEIVSTRVEVSDPDVADTHSMATGTAPMHGDVVTEDDGTVHYRAHADYEGPDSFTVIVSDSGVPSMTAEVTFTVTVLPPEEEGGCGCRTGGGGGATSFVLLAAALLPLTWRRRRR